MTSSDNPEPGPASPAPPAPASTVPGSTVPASTVLANTVLANTVPASTVPGGDLLPERSQEDTDAAWGDLPERDDDRLYRDRPPHWDDY